MEEQMDSVCRIGDRQAALLRAGVQETRFGHDERAFLTHQYAIVYWHRGKGTYRDEKGRMFAITPGCLMQRFPGRGHSVRVDGASVRAWLAVPGAVLELLQAFRLAGWKTPVLQIGQDSRRLREVRALVAELRDAPERQLPAVMANMQRVMTAWLMQAAQAEPDSASAAVAREAVRRLGETSHLRKPLPALARELGVPYSTLRKYVIRHVGVPPGEYQLRRRLERAMELLADPQRQVQEVAAGLGYPDVYAFSAQFRRKLGVGPQEYRKQQGILSRKV